jgi:hypothetical protein
MAPDAYQIRLEGKVDDLIEVVTELRVEVARDMVTRKEMTDLQTQSTVTRRWAVTAGLAAFVALIAAAPLATLFIS